MRRRFKGWGMGGECCARVFLSFPILYILPLSPPHPGKIRQDIMEFVCFLFVCCFCLFLAERTGKEDIL